MVPASVLDPLQKLAGLNGPLNREVWVGRGPAMIHQSTAIHDDDLLPFHIDFALFLNLSKELAAYCLAL